MVGWPTMEETSLRKKVQKTEKDKQKGEYIGKYLSIARRAHAALLDQYLKDYGICHGQILILVTIYQNEGLHQQEICSTYNLDKAGVNRSIKKLEEAGFIIKKPDPEDKRKKKIYLTEKAEEFHPQLMDILSSVEEQVRQNLSSQEINTFLNIIKKISSNLGVDIEI